MYRVFVRSTRSLLPSPEGEHAPDVRAALDSMTAARRRCNTALHLRAGCRSPYTSDLRPPCRAALARRLSARASSTRLAPDPSGPQQRLAARPDRCRFSRRAAERCAGRAAARLARQSRVLVTAPDYVARHSIPATPAALEQREALRFMLGDRLPAAEIANQSVNGPASISAAAAATQRDWVVSGGPSRARHRLQVVARRRRRRIATGELLHINAHWGGEPAPLNLVVTGRKPFNVAVRALHAHAARVRAVAPAAHPRSNVGPDRHAAGWRREALACIVFSDHSNLPHPAEMTSFADLLQKDRALASDTLIAQLPKAELHLHIEGSFEPDDVYKAQKLASRSPRQCGGRALPTTLAATCRSSLISITRCADVLRDRRIFTT